MGRKTHKTPEGNVASQMENKQQLILYIIEGEERWRGGLAVEMKKLTTPSWVEDEREARERRTDEALQRSMKRASIIQQLWIMGQHAEAVVQIRGRDEKKKTCCIHSCGKPSWSGLGFKKQRLGRVHVFQLLVQSGDTTDWYIGADASLLLNNIYN